MATISHSGADTHEAIYTIDDLVILYQDFLAETNDTMVKCKYYNDKQYVMILQNEITEYLRRTIPVINNCLTPILTFGDTEVIFMNGLHKVKTSLEHLNHIFYARDDYGAGSIGKNININKGRMQRIMDRFKMGIALIQEVCNVVAGDIYS